MSASAQRVTRLVHVLDPARHERRSVLFTATDTDRLDGKISAYFGEREHLRIVCIDPEVTA